MFFAYIISSSYDTSINEFSQKTPNPFSPYQHKPGMEPFNPYAEQEKRIQKIREMPKNPAPSPLLQEPQQPYFYNPYEANRQEMTPQHQFRPQFEYGANEQRSSGSTPGMYNETSYAGSTAGTFSDTNYAGSTTGSFGK